MVTKNEALERIEEISQVMNQSLAVSLPGKLLIAIGAAVLAVPIVELLLQSFLDPYLQVNNCPMLIIFVLRTVFYWGSFALLSRMFVQAEEMPLHPAIKKAWGLNSIFPIVPVATGGMLALIGLKALAMPVVLVLVGCYFALVGRFTHIAVTWLASVLIIVGVGSIYLTTYDCPYLYLYLLAFQGCACVITGLIMRFSCHE